MILVTGGTGLVGSHLLFHLSKGEEPICAIRRSKDVSCVYKIFKFYSDEAQKLFDKIHYLY